MAIDSAIEAGVPLFLVNLIPLPLYVRTMVLVGAEGTTFPHEEDLDAVRATAHRAAELGVKTELLRVRTRHAVPALLEVLHERDAGLLVFGPDLGRVAGCDSAPPPGGCGARRIASCGSRRDGLGPAAGRGSRSGSTTRVDAPGRAWTPAAGCDTNPLYKFVRRAPTGRGNGGQDVGRRALLGTRL